MVLTKRLSIAFALITSSSALQVWADGLNDLQSALAKLENRGAVSGTLHVSFSEFRDDGDDKKVKTGDIKSMLSHNVDGLDIRYSEEVLNKISQENKAKIANEEIDTPTLNGAEVLSASAIIPIFSSAQKINEYINQGEFINEQAINHNDKNLRLLSFNLPLESFIDDKKIRGYVSKFQGSFGVVIDDSGVPIETRMSYSGKGSAYIFFSLSAESEIISTFQVNSGRLVQTKRTVSSSSSSTFNDRKYQGTWQLTLH